jgi:hypothetical protein
MLSTMYFYTYVHAYVNYQKPFHSSLTHKKIKHMSADIKVIFPHTDGYQVQTPEKYRTQPYIFFVRSAMQ